MTLCLVAAVTSCGFNFSLDGKCFEGETYITNPNCPPPDGADSTDSVDGLDAIDSVGTTGIDTVDGMDGIDAVVDGVEGADSTDATDSTDTTDGTSDGTDGTDATDGTEPTDSEDGSDSTDATDGTVVLTCVVDTDCIDDGNPCTTTKCDPNGECVHPPNSELCDDGNACTAGDVCQAGECTGTSITCDDANPCTTDTCTSPSGCVFVFNTATCDDGNPCSVSDVCNSGTCQSGNNMCACKTDTDCVPHNDDNLCNGQLHCLVSGGVGNCVPDESTVVVCNTNQNTDCLTAVCVPATGECALQSTHEQEACSDDGDACTILETCQNGQCLGKPRVCDDDDLCTGTESCDPTSGCVPGTPKVCNDGEACNGLETCITIYGGCIPGIPKNCSDSDPCTLDSCTSGSGNCVHDVGALDCDDTNPCTFDLCVPVVGCLNQGGLQLEDIACNDGNACTTVDACNSTGQCVGNEPVVCTAMDQCHDAGTCDVATGECSQPTVKNSTPCNDGTLCTTGDVCVEGTCVGNELPPCVPDACHTKGFCNPEDGQCYQEDADLVQCPTDNVPCTYDSWCDPLVGCYHLDIGRLPNSYGNCGVDSTLTSGNLDFDEFPDYADQDADADGICDPGVFWGGQNCTYLPNDKRDNASRVYNPDQSDQDGDGLGDVIDPDADGSGCYDASFPIIPAGACVDLPVSP